MGRSRWDSSDDEEKRKRRRGQAESEPSKKAKSDSALPQAKPSATGLESQQPRRRKQETPRSRILPPSDGIDVTGLRLHSLLNGCRNLESYYERLNKISEGSFGMVFRARSKETNQIVAIKSLKDIAELKSEGFYMAALREFSGLLDLGHPNVIEAVEVVTDFRRQVYMVMEYVEHELRVLLRNNKPEFSLSEKKRLMVEVLQGVEYIHTRGYIHRDLKTANLLYTNNGVIKICDFGLAKKLESDRENTSVVATLWYRAPECVLQGLKYGKPLDLWAVGCIIGEILVGKPLFPASSEAQILHDICALIGSPSEDDQLALFADAKGRFVFPRSVEPSWRGKFPLPSRTFMSGSVTQAGIDLLKGLLAWNPHKRLTATEALDHPFFKESPLPQSMSFMPSAPDTNLSGEERYGCRIQRLLRLCDQFIDEETRLRKMKLESSDPDNELTLDDIWKDWQNRGQHTNLKMFKKPINSTTQTQIDKNACHPSPYIERK